MSIKAGQQLSHYRLIEKIGEGGMGVVWKAEDTRLHRHVALKFVPEAGAENTDAVDRHLREARAASSLNHPNICVIYDIGEWEGRRFIVMELLEGRGLDERIQREPLDVETAHGDGFGHEAREDRLQLDVERIPRHMVVAFAPDGRHADGQEVVQRGHGPRRLAVQ